MGLFVRGRTWHLRMHVPQRYAAIERRRDIWISLHTDSRAEAEKKAVVVAAEQMNVWEALRRGDTEEAEITLASAKTLAKAMGFKYLDAKQVSQLPIEDLLTRVEAVEDKLGRVDQAKAVATLGLVSEGAMRLSQALEAYWGLVRDKERNKSPDQLQRARAPRLRAFKNLISVIGDKPLESLTGDDMLEFREWWMNKVTAEELSTATANKDLTHIKSTLTLVNKLRRLGLKLPLDGLLLSGGKVKQRRPYGSDWIRHKILAPGAFDGLNAEARAILHVMVNTGMRPIEIVNLTPAEIHLDHAVPHIGLQPIGRDLKSDNAERRIPLIGVSLEAMRIFPSGFKRYRDNSGTLSAVVNKYMREHGLHETAEHTLYGLRHAFEDRMLAAGIDERIRRDLMGHALERERYGDGGSLEHVQAILRPISF